MDRNARLDVIGLIPGDGAFHWRRGQLTILSGGDRREAPDVNQRGQIVGDSCTEAVEPECFPALWEAKKRGRIFPAEELAGVPGTPLAINNRGEIVGVVGQLAVMWQEQELVLLPAPSGHTEFLQTFARAINERGVIVGSSFDPGPAGGGEQHAVVWQDGNITDLNAVIADDLAEFITLTDAVDVNERGQIAVNGFDSRRGAGRAYVLTPVRR